MKVAYFFLFISGLAVTAWALPASYRLRSPWHVLAALAALAGVIAILAGALLVAVPGFFSR